MLKSQVANLQACNFIKKSLRISEIFKNTYFEEHLRATASGPINVQVFFTNFTLSESLHGVQFIKRRGKLDTLF